MVWRDASTLKPVDLNLDGTIGADDLLIFLMEWGTICF